MSLKIFYYSIPASILGLCVFFQLFRKLYYEFRYPFLLGLKLIAFWSSITTFGGTLILWYKFNALSAKIQGVWIINEFILPFSDNIAFIYSFGIDGINITFIILTSFIFPLCVLGSWDFLDKEDPEFVLMYLVNLLVLEFFILNAFCVLDMFYFFVFFEAILIPMIFIIGIWGPGDRTIKANYYFIFYTLFGSAFLLFSVILVMYEFGSTSYLVIYSSYISNIRLQIAIGLGFFFAFAIKIPMFPFHIWLPEAHVEAPTVGSVILASILLKLGGYGLIRFFPIVPYALWYFNPTVITLSVIGILYSSLSTLRQVDLKKIIAYSSIAHMNLVVLGIFCFNFQSIQGSIFLMISHGLVSSALFFLVGFLYDRYSTKLLKYYGGLVLKMPVFGTFFFFFCICNLGFPGTSSFIGELLVLIGVSEKNMSLMIISASGMLFSTIYSMWMFNRVLFGTLKLVYIENYVDLLRREYYIILILIAATLFLGISPSLLLELTYISVKNWVSFRKF